MTAASLVWITFFLVSVPMVTGFLFVMPQYRRVLLGLMVFLLCYVKKPFYQEVFYVEYRGVDRGYLVSLADILFFGFFFWILLGGLRQKIRWLPYNSIPWFILILWCALSLFASLNAYYGTFTIHKFIRCWILYFVVVNLVRDRRDVIAVVLGLVGSLYFEASYVFFDKYITGAVVNRSVGTFRHPNTLAMYINLISPALLAILLSNEFKPWLNRLILVALFAGLISVIFTKSRAAIVLHPFALGTTAMISFLWKPTAKKAGLLLLGLLGALVIGAMALPRIIRRFEKAPEESLETRILFNDAARAMANENLFGIGLNCYSLALSDTDYYWYVYPDFVDVADPEAFRESTRGMSRLGVAHHIYYLYAAEVGWVGMGIFVWHIAMFWLFNLYAWLRARSQLHKAIFLGLLVSTTIHHAHGTLEWVFRQTEVIYLFFALMGLMVAVWTQENEGRRKARRMRTNGRKVSRNSLSPRPELATLS